MNQIILLAEAASSQEAPAGGLFGGVFGMVIYLGVLFGIMWLLIIRPQRKREKEIQSMQYSAKIGDSIMTTGGLYGKIVDIVNDVCIVEFGLNKGIRIPIERSYIATIKEPDMTIKKEEIIEDKKEDAK
ncbi:MAG: preprotein translocase subunit YajC [Epulopiscium sp.]|nr:preprotein translocase subunit YajC [Candidatus Epulonipiscium sp.]